jgi:uncharacterized membrane protein
VADPTWNDHRVEQTIGHLLRAGLAAAAALVIAGAALYLVHHGTEIPDYRVFRGEPADLRGLGGILAGAFDLRGRGLIQLGILVLLATPVARVLFSVVAFALERDTLYVGVTFFVLAVLLYSILGGSA